MRSCADTVETARECGLFADRANRQSQKEFYGDLERLFLGIAAIKQWLHETDKNSGIESSIT
jgi:hypothetical protein